VLPFVWGGPYFPTGGQIGVSYLPCPRGLPMCRDRPRASLFCPCSDGAYHRGGDGDGARYFPLLLMGTRCSGVVLSRWRDELGPTIPH